jgi:hypothetical protein
MLIDLNTSEHQLREAVIQHQSLQKTHRG